MSTEREDLENLVKSPGWQRVRQWAISEWREQIAQATDTAANATNDTDALNKLRQIIAARKAVELVTGWPDDRLKELTRSAAPRPFSLQRGGL